MTVVWIALGAVVGGPLRYVVDRAIRSRRDTTFPWGTLTVNVAASAVLGTVVGAGTHTPALVSALVGTGFCGALSTYSTFGYENHQLVNRRAYATAVAYVAASLVVGVGAAALGWWAGRALG